MGVLSVAFSNSSYDAGFVSKWRATDTDVIPQGKRQVKSPVYFTALGGRLVSCRSGGACDRSGALRGIQVFEQVLGAGFRHQQ